MMVLPLYLFPLVVSLVGIFADYRQAPGINCSLPFGCPLLPRDVAFDTETRDALNQLRNHKSKEEELMLLQQLKSSGNEREVTLTLVGYKGGELQDQVNQDRALVLNPFGVKSRQQQQQQQQSVLLGVFDGHGPEGEQVSQYAVSELPNILGTKLQSIFNDNEEEAMGQEQLDDRISRSLKESFVELDKTTPSGNAGGCTASVVLQVGQKAYIANAGDSVSMVALYNSANDAVTLVAVSREDKPHLPGERARIEGMGGQVYVPHDLQLESSRVLSGNNGLAMSRSIGDWDMVGCIAEPLVQVVDIEKLKQAEQVASSCSNKHGKDGVCVASENAIHAFAVSATDGMIDYVKPQEIAQAFASSLYRRDVNAAPHPLTMAEDLIIQAATGWTNEMGGQYRDDIAVAAAKLL